MTFDKDKYKRDLTSSNDYIRDTALFVLWHSGTRDDEIDSRIAAIVGTDDSIKIRRNAVRMIASLRVRKFLPLLIQCLQDSDYIIRGEAFIGISSLDDDFDKIPAVKTFMNEESHPYCIWCIQKMRASRVSFTT